MIYTGMYMVLSFRRYYNMCGLLDRDIKYIIKALEQHDQIEKDFKTREKK